MLHDPVQTRRLGAQAQASMQALSAHTKRACRRYMERACAIYTYEETNAGAIGTYEEGMC